MAQSFDLLEQAGRCRRLARDSTDANARDRFLELADQYTAQGAAREDQETQRRTQARTTRALPDVSKSAWDAGTNA
jgi:hypothetical protein